MGLWLVVDLSCNIRDQSCTKLRIDRLYATFEKAIVSSGYSIQEVDLHYAYREVLDIALLDFVVDNEIVDEGTCAGVDFTELLSLLSTHADACIEMLNKLIWEGMNS